MNIQIYTINIPFKFSFNHSSQKRTTTHSVMVTCERKGLIGYGESCPREYVTGESVNTVIQFISSIKSKICQIDNLDDLVNWRESNKHVTDKSLAGWCAIELALIDLLSKVKGISIEQMLNVSPPGNNQKITAVIGDFEIDSFEKNVNKYHQLSFFDFKLKMSGDIKRDQQKIDCIRRIKNTNELTIRADYNNCFKDEYTFLRYYEKLNYAFIAIEEPIVKNSIDKLELIAEETSTPIILDESFVSISDLAKVSNPSLLIPNIRISKLGGIMNAIDTYRKLVNTFSRFILGSHVGETSILTRYFCIALDEMQQNLIGAEGGYSTYILEEDLASPSINTMPPGIIELPLDTRNNSGIGINIDINSKYLKRIV